MKINEILISEGRSRTISEEQAIKLKETSHSIAVTSQPIYRGLPNETIRLYASNEGHRPRESANTTNQMTLCMDNFENWSSFPKRSKSFICSTSKHTASVYGNVYRVYPHNSATIGICSSSDMWVSFSNLNDIHMDVDEFNTVLQHFSDNPTTYNQFVADVNALEVNDIKVGPYDYELVKVVGKFKESNYSSFLDFLKAFLDPVANGFKVAPMSAFRAGDDNEVWTEGPILLELISS